MKKSVNAKRRKAVMSRSIKLGHCVCNPRKPCPCDVYNGCQGGSVYHRANSGRASSRVQTTQMKRP